MNTFIRTTHERTVDHLVPSLAQAIREYFEAQQLGDPDTTTLLCCETVSEREEGSRIAAFLDGIPDKTVYLATLLTSEWLIWARYGDKSGTIVWGARLKKIKVKAFVAKRSKDMILEINGFIGDTKEYVRGNLELGPQPAAQKFCDEILQAVNIANPPSKRSLSRWFGM